MYWGWTHQDEVKLFQSGLCIEWVPTESVYLYGEEKAFSQYWVDNADAINRNGNFKIYEPSVIVCVIKQCTIHVWEESLIHIYIRTSLLKKTYSIMSEFIYWTIIKYYEKKNYIYLPPHPSIKLALSGNKST